MTDFHHAWVPGSSDKVLLLLHGTGGDEHGLLEIGRAIAPGWSLLGVRGKVSENGANRYFRRFAEGVFDAEDLASRTTELASWLNDETHPWQGQPLVVFGYSNGANMAANLMLTGSGILSGAAMLRPMVPSEPVPGLHLEGVKTQVQVGSADPICPPEDGKRLASLLEAAGAETLLRTTGTSHSLTQADILAATEFMAAFG
ncbi:MAG: alpha/beta hydrolase [bacterium]